MKKSFMKIFGMLMFVTLILSSCNNEVSQLIEGTWLTHVYGNGANGEDSIYVDATVAFILFERDNIFKPAGTVTLRGKGSVIFLINNDEFELVSNDGKKRPAVIESMGDFNAVGTWSVDADKIIVEWNADSTKVDVGQGECINLNELDRAMFMLKYGVDIAHRSVGCNPQVIKAVNDWLKQRSKLTFNDTENEWNAIVNGLEIPVLWRMKTKK